MAVQQPIMFLRVKRPRAPTAHQALSPATDDFDVDDGEQPDVGGRSRRIVTICCREVVGDPAVHRNGGPASSSQVVCGAPSSSSAQQEQQQQQQRPLRRYTFERVVKNSLTLPPLPIPKENVSEGVELSGGGGDASDADDALAMVVSQPVVDTDSNGIKRDQPKVVVEDTATTEATTSAVVPPLTVESNNDIGFVLAQLSLDDRHATSHHTATDHNKKSVKALPSGAEIANHQLSRRQAQAVAVRASLRCERIGACRGTGVVCIDATTVLLDDDNHNINASNEEDDLAYDLYVLRSQASVEDDDDDAEEAGALDENAEHEDSSDTTLHHIETAFDDDEDEFCFNIKASISSSAKHLLLDRKMRRGLHAARVLELVNVPQSTSQWVTYSDDRGLTIDATTTEGQLLPDDGLPEGADNYVYFDHRNDDEYDSNAEDFGANEYPEEDDSSHDGGDDDWEGGGGGQPCSDDDYDDGGGGWGGSGGGDDEEREY